MNVLAGEQGHTAEILATLQVLLGESRVPVRVAACELLDMLAADGVIEDSLIARILANVVERDRSHQVRSLAATSVAAMRSDASRTIVHGWATCSSASLRATTAAALGMASLAGGASRCRDGLSLLLALANDSSQRVRSWAVFSLGSLPGAPCVDAERQLGLALSDPSPDVRAEAVVGLARRRRRAQVRAHIELSLAQGAPDRRYLMAAAHIADPTIHPLISNLDKSWMKLTPEYEDAFKHTDRTFLRSRERFVRQLLAVADESEVRVSVFQNLTSSRPDAYSLAIDGTSEAVWDIEALMRRAGTRASVALRMVVNDQKSLT
jgi:hypothetical protein